MSELSDVSNALKAGADALVVRVAAAETKTASAIAALTQQVKDLSVPNPDVAAAVNSMKATLDELNAVDPGVGPTGPTGVPAPTGPTGVPAPTGPTGPTGV